MPTIASLKQDLEQKKLEMERAKINMANSQTRMDEAIKEVEEAGLDIEFPARPALEEDLDAYYKKVEEVLAESKETMRLSVEEKIQEASEILENWGA